MFSCINYDFHISNLEKVLAHPIVGIFKINFVNRRPKSKVFTLLTSRRYQNNAHVLVGALTLLKCYCYNVQHVSDLIDNIRRLISVI